MYSILVTSEKCKNRSSFPTSIDRDEISHPFPFPPNNTSANSFIASNNYPPCRRWTLGSDRIEEELSAVSEDAKKKEHAWANVLLSSPGPRPLLGLRR